MTKEEIEKVRSKAYSIYEDARNSGLENREAIQAAINGCHKLLKQSSVNPASHIVHLSKLKKELDSKKFDPIPKRERTKLEENFLTSPYRFVALNDVVVPPEAGGPPALDEPVKGGFCGTITVTWAVETPLLIGEERREPNRDRDRDSPVSGPMQLGKGGLYVIPGATLRGCVRAALEIVAAARLTQINGHHRYGLRDFDHPRIRWIEDGDEKSLLDRNKVKAGWLRRGEDGRYWITPCRDWKTIAIADLPGRGTTDEYQWRHDWLKMTVAKRYDAVGVTVAGNRIDFSTAMPRTFETRPDSETGELKLKSGGPVSGTLVFSNKSPSAPPPDKIREMERNGKTGQPKKREYVFIDDPEARPFPIPDEAWQRFELINTTPGRNKRTPNGSWRDLHPSLEPPDGRVPVFFIGDPDKKTETFEFGLTRFFKVAHEHSVESVRNRTAAHKREKVADPDTWPRDFVESLFGYVYEKDDVYTDGALKEKGAHVAPRDVARKGRVAFGFATLDDTTPASETEVINTIMGAPRASFAPFYLEGVFKDWSDGNAKLAGRKRYLPRYPHGRLAEAKKKVIDSLNAQNNAGSSDDPRSRLTFLVPAEAKEELRFNGTIRLHNVTAAEVGALLWVLTHGMRSMESEVKPYRHMIGRAKPFGAGQTRVADLRLALTGNDAEAVLRLTPPTPDEATTENGPERWTTGAQSLTPFIQAFEHHMDEARPGWQTSTDLEEFLAASDPRHGQSLEKADRMTYPELKKFNNIRKFAKLYFTPHTDPERDRPRFLPVIEGRNRR